MIDGLARIHDRNLYGNKAFNLSQIIKHNILVPKGIVISDTIRQQNPNIEELEKLLKQDKTFNSFVNHEKNYAVRSSSNLEDGNKYAFPGQFESLLNVKVENIASSIISCWNSSKSERLQDYALALSINIDNLSFAVIIQEFLKGNFSGTLFTQSPMSKKEEMLLEVKAGTCDALVSGNTIADTYLINSDNIRHMYGRNKNILSKNQIYELAEIGKQIVSIFKYPQDIEWTIYHGNIYILQPRAITTLKK